MITEQDATSAFDRIEAENEEQVRKSVKKKHKGFQRIIITPILDNEGWEAVKDRLIDRYATMMKGTHISIPIAGVPQGSNHAFIVKNKQGMNRAVITDNNKESLYGERIAIKTEYENAKGILYDKDVPIALNIVFAYVKPKSASKRVRYKVTKPDTDKLVRGVLDSLTGVAYYDDSQVVQINAKKIFADSERIEIHVKEYRE